MLPISAQSISVFCAFKGSMCRLVDADFEYFILSVYIVGNINPYSAYVKSNQAATAMPARNSKPFIITSS